MYHGSKLPLLKQALKKLKDTRNDDTIVMFSDAYDVRIFANVQYILKTFKEFDANVVFGAEYFYAPKPEILKMYPLIANGGMIQIRKIPKTPFTMLQKHSKCEVKVHNIRIYLLINLA